VERILRLDPLDIDSAERLLPELRKAGMGVLADEAFEKIMDRGIEHAAEFPCDATSCNNVAWVAAMNRQRLDEALVLSERAVYLEPDSAIYRDTLAEVLFQLGRKQEALEVEESCLLDDPSQWHLHQQIEKYRAAIASAAAEQ
jgi:tetratricopeptide (TPR) repeat protein